MLLNIRSDLWKGLIIWQSGSGQHHTDTGLCWMLLGGVDLAKEKNIPTSNIKV